MKAVERAINLGRRLRSDHGGGEGVPMIFHSHWFDSYQHGHIFLFFLLFYFLTSISRFFLFSLFSNSIHSSSSSSSSSSSMAFKKTLAHRLFNLSKISAQALTKCRISSSSLALRFPPHTNTSNIAHDPGDHSVFRRFLHKRAVVTQPAISPELRELAAGGNIVEKFKSLGIASDRIRLDCLRPPASETLATDWDGSDVKNGLTVEDARKLLRVTRMEMVKRDLREIQKSWVPYSEFVRVCCQGCDDSDQGLEIAQMLDESGTVIVLGNVVYLRPEQVICCLPDLDLCSYFTLSLNWIRDFFFVTFCLWVLQILMLLTK